MASGSDAPRPASPSGSFYAMSDDDEGDYDTITHTKAGHGVKLLFSKSKVYIHPTPSAKDNIPGYIALLHQKGQPAGTGTSTSTSHDRPATSSSATSSRSPAPSDLLLAWVPESQLGEAASIYVKVDLCDADSPPKKAYLVPPPPTVTTLGASLSTMPNTASTAPASATSPNSTRSSASPLLPTASASFLAAGHHPFAVPVSAIYSLLVRPPNRGWWHGSVVVNSRAGDSFPALFFHDAECKSTMLQKQRRTRATFDPFGESGEMFWGGDEVLRWLRRYVRVERSTHEPNIYLMEPSAEDSAAFGGKTSTARSIGRRDTNNSPGGRPGGSSGPAGGMASTAAAAGSGASALGLASPSRGGRGESGAGMDPLMKFVRETGWNIMERFSKVTTFTRQAANDVLFDNPRVPPQVRRLLHNPEVQTLQDEFDSARIYLARWAMGIAEQSERDRRRREWTASDMLALEATGVGDFELLDSHAGSSSLGAPPAQANRKPVTMAEWRGWFDGAAGQLSVTEGEVKERIFHGGLDPDDGVRKEAWLFLLGVYGWYDTADERRARAASLRDEYIRLKGAWWERQVDLGGGGAEGEWWREQRGRIEKDVHRTDRNVPIFAGEDIPHPDPDSPFAAVGTNVHMEQLKDMLLTYNELSGDLGYCQGMSDLLAPVYAVLQDDALAFWAFAGFMDGRMRPNFARDQSGMRAQLGQLDALVRLMDPALHAHLEAADSTNFFFFFRMLLVWYKREFDWPDVLRLWEALWTDHLTASFHLFVALAILQKHRDVIMAHLRHFDEVLKYVNELSGTMDLESTLIRAEALFLRFRRIVEAIDKRGNFPAPRLQQQQQQQQQQPSSASSATTPTSQQQQQEQGQSTTAALESTSTPPPEAPDQQPRQQHNHPRHEQSQGQKQQQQLQSPATPNASERIITPELRRLLSRKAEPPPPPPAPSPARTSSAGESDGAGDPRPPSRERRA